MCAQQIVGLMLSYVHTAKPCSPRHRFAAEARKRNFPILPPLTAAEGRLVGGLSRKTDAFDGTAYLASAWRVGSPAAQPCRWDCLGLVRGSRTASIFDSRIETNAAVLPFLIGLRTDGTGPRGLPSRPADNPGAKQTRTPR